MIRFGLRQRLPLVLAIGLLLGAVMVGARKEWKINSFSELVGRSINDIDDWCAEHAVAKSECIACNAHLFATIPEPGWCSKHGVHTCPHCHPEMAQTPDQPAVSDSDLVRIGKTLDGSEGRPSNQRQCKLHPHLIQIASLETLRRSGMEFAAVRREAMAESVEAPAETTFIPGRKIRITPRAAGEVVRMDKHVGDRVAAGDVLAIIDSLEVGQSKSEFLLALSQVETARRNARVMRESSAAFAGLKLTEADAAVEESQLRLIAARQSLGQYGFSSEAAEWSGLSPNDAAKRLRLIGAGSSEDLSANRLAVIAPQSGIVTEIHATPGERTDSTRPLLTVVDTSSLWLTMDVQMHDVDRLTVGNRIQVEFANGERQETVLDWISPAADEKTRTVQARARLENRHGQLKEHQFGVARIILREDPAAVVVPSDAVHWDGQCQIVFVRDRQFEKPNSPKVFHVRSVRTGVSKNGLTEIIAGLIPGETVASTGSGSLRAELLKNNLGAGCDCGK